MNTMTCVIIHLVVLYLFILQALAVRRFRGFHCCLLGAREKDNGAHGCQASRRHAIGHGHMRELVGGETYVHNESDRSF